MYFNVGKEFNNHIDLEVKGQGPTKVITVRDTLPYVHAPTDQISLSFLERQKCYGSDKKIVFKDTWYVGA
jgi:hypothetical protein